MALSTSFGRFVAPMTTTVHLLSVAKPSHSCINCALIIAVASWSCWSLTRRRLSISSMKMMQGCSFSARVNTAPAIFCDSPYHLSVSEDMSRLRNLAPASLKFKHIVRIINVTSQTLNN